MVKATSSAPKTARLKTSDETKELVEFVDESVAELMLDLHGRGQPGGKRDNNVPDKDIHNVQTRLSARSVGVDGGGRKERGGRAVRIDWNSDDGISRSRTEQRKKE